MPVRKSKVIQKETPSTIEETPVVFFLKILDDTQNNIIPVGEMTSYSDILSSVDVIQTSNRFNTDLLKTVLENVVADRYTPQTACFWCCHAFNWSPALLPVSYDAYKNLFFCQGNFCSPECALSYNYDDVKASDSVKWTRHSLLFQLYNTLYAERDLSPAPPRSLLRMFGGPLDIEQYRDYTSNSNDIVLADLPPIRLLFPSMNVQGPIRDIKKYVALSTDVVEKASKQLRLKRTKPVDVNIPTLDMCIKKN